MKSDLRFHRVLIGRECPTLDNDFMSRRRRPIERHHHQVKIYRERIHNHNFCGLGSYKCGGLVSKQPVIRHPRICSLKVPLDAKFGPVF